MNRERNRPDYAEIIKSMVSVPEVVERYTGQRIVRNRIQCPVHHGTDYNMRIYRDTYYCWVCHATGDAIQLLRSVTGDTFMGAMQRLNRDFCLDLPLDGSEQKEADRKALEQANRALAERRVREMLDDADTVIAGVYAANIAGLIHDTDLIIKRYAPYNGWSKWRADWCEAIRLRELLNEQV